MRRALPVLVLPVLALAAALVGPASLATTALPPNLERALEAQRRLVAERPADPAVWNDLGNLQVIEGRWDDAEASYVRALELAPGHAEARFNLGLLYQQSGRRTRAAEQFSAVIELQPAHAWSHYQLGVLAEEGGDRRGAIAHYAQAFAIDPGLSFPENNPHVIDNRLMTEALLSADRYSSYPEVVPPRQFDEGRRIVDLLLDTEAAAERLAEAEAKRRAAGPYDAPERPEPTHPPVAADAADAVPGTGAQPATGVGTPGVPAGAAVETVGGVTVVRPAGAATSTAEPLPGGGRERVVPGDDRAPATGVDEPVGAAPGRTIVVPPVTTGTPQTPPRGQFRPARTSTGRLDLRLLPADDEPAERVASVTAPLR